MIFDLLQAPPANASTPTKSPANTAGAKSNTLIPTGAKTSQGAFVGQDKDLLAETFEANLEQLLLASQGMAVFPSAVVSQSSTPATTAPQGTPTDGPIILPFPSLKAQAILGMQSVDQAGKTPQGKLLPSGPLVLTSFPVSISGRLASPSPICGSGSPRSSCQAYGSTASSAGSTASSAARHAPISGEIAGRLHAIELDACHVGYHGRTQWSGVAHASAKHPGLESFVRDSEGVNLSIPAPEDHPLDQGYREASSLLESFQIERHTAAPLLQISDSGRGTLPTLRDLSPALQLAREVVIQHEAGTSKAGGETRFSMRLDPPELGTVRVSMIVTEHTVRARVTVTTELAKHLLEVQHTQFRQTLAESGITLRSFDVYREDANQGGEGGHAFQDPRDNPWQGQGQERRERRSQQQRRSNQQKETKRVEGLDVVV
jgi:hypothetical protein